MTTALERKLIDNCPNICQQTCQDASTPSGLQQNRMNWQRLALIIQQLNAAADLDICVWGKTVPGYGAAAWWQASDALGIPPEDDKYWCRVRMVTDYTGDEYVGDAIPGVNADTPSYSEETNTTRINATTSCFSRATTAYTILYTVSGNVYTISSISSGTRVYVDGDASGELSGAAFTVSLTYDVVLPDRAGREPDLPLGSVIAIAEAKDHVLTCISDYSDETEQAQFSPTYYGRCVYNWEFTNGNCWKPQPPFFVQVYLCDEDGETGFEIVYNEVTGELDTNMPAPIKVILLSRPGTTPEVPNVVKDQVIAFKQVKDYDAGFAGEPENGMTAGAFPFYGAGYVCVSSFHAEPVATVQMRCRWGTSGTVTGVSHVGGVTTIDTSTSLITASDIGKPIIFLDGDGDFLGAFTVASYVDENTFTVTGDATGAESFDFGQLPDPVADGWAVMDGSSNDIERCGSGIDMTDRFVKGTATSENVGTEDGEEEHTHTAENHDNHSHELSLETPTGGGSVIKSADGDYLECVSPVLSTACGEAPAGVLAHTINATATEPLNIVLLFIERVSNSEGMRRNFL